MNHRCLFLATAAVLLVTVFGLIAVAHARTTVTEATPPYQDQAQPTAEPTAQPSATPHPDVDIAQLDDPIPEGIPADFAQGAQDNNGPKFGDRIEPGPEPWGPDVTLPAGLFDPDTPAPDAARESATTLSPPPAPTVEGGNGQLQQRSHRLEARVRSGGVLYCVQEERLRRLELQALSVSRQRLFGRFLVMRHGIHLQRQGDGRR